MPLGPHTIDVLAETLTREELIMFWKCAVAEREAAYAEVAELERKLKTREVTQ